MFSKRTSRREPRLAATALAAGRATTAILSALTLVHAGLAFTIAEQGDAGVVQALSSWRLARDWSCEAKAGAWHRIPD